PGCHVLYVSGQMSPELNSVHGVLSEAEDALLPVFSASVPDQDFAPGTASPKSPRRFYFDAVPEFPAAVAFKKKYVLSVYFLSPESYCPGANNTQLSPKMVKRDFSAQHVYIEDGTHETREAAFKHYHFTMLCGDFSSSSFPPLPLVYSLAYVAHAMVPEFIHWKSSRMFFHLPDAAQGVRSTAFAGLEVVRETWGRGLAGKAPAVVQRFFVGKAANSSHALHDSSVGDVVELPVVESYRTLNIKALSMLSWAHRRYPNLQWLVRHDDDVYLRAPALLAQLASRPPIRYLWGMFDHGSSPVRDPAHQHYNSYEQFPKQDHPAWGDIFPPYARGLLWAMSADLVAATVKEFMADREEQPDVPLDEAAADHLPHPDDPAVGVLIAGLVQRGMSINLDDRDFNSFSLNPSCNSTFSNIHNRTWVVHHVQPETMRCMWDLDNAEEAKQISSQNSDTCEQIRNSIGQPEKQLDVV
ncbi:unnamed protein product, partial [Durusdinium trenchii]